MTTYTTEQLEFLHSCAICTKSAAEEGKKLFVRRRGIGFTVSGDGGDGWLFTAYPGGRKILSVAGKGIVTP